MNEKFRQQDLINRVDPAFVPLVLLTPTQQELMEEIMYYPVSEIASRNNKSVNTVVLQLANIGTLGLKDGMASTYAIGELSPTLVRMALIQDGIMYGYLPYKQPKSLAEIKMLTTKEDQLLQMTHQGMEDTQIALALGVSKKRVESLLSAAYKKLGLPSESEMGEKYVKKRYMAAGRYYYLVRNGIPFRAFEQ